MYQHGLHGGRLYVSIIIIHGMKCSCRNHYTCNMKKNALASCISYAWSHRIKSGVGAGYDLFTGVGEWVVNSEIWDKVQGRDS